MDFDRFTITLLVLRDDAPEFTPEQEDALQDAHMSHLADLHRAGHLLAAGPLLERASRFRGLSILSVGVEEARALKESDPAVQAGKYTVMALPWMVPAGAMSFSPAHFPRSASEATRSSEGPQSTPPPAPRSASLPVGHQVSARLAADLSRKISLICAPRPISVARLPTAPIRRIPRGSPLVVRLRHVTAPVWRGD